MTRATSPRYAKQQHLIRLIHVAKRELCMDDDTYRAMLRDCTQKDTTALMSPMELQAVLDRMKRSGFRVRHKSANSRPLAQYPEATKIRALWLFLHQLGAVKNPSEEALAAYVKRVARVDALQWLNGQQTETVIESLKKWAMRFLPDKVKAMAQTLAAAVKAGSVVLADEELIHLRAMVGEAQERHTFDPMLAAYDELNLALERSKGAV
jgi:phage gp16-like protein